jgi:hypothetical protein
MIGILELAVVQAAAPGAGPMINPEAGGSS